MRINIIIIILFLIFKAIAQQAAKTDPYSILKLSNKATKSEIDSQYKKLRQKNKHHKANTSKIKKAYLQIKSQKNKTKKLKIIETKSKVKPFLKKQLDEPYVYGYRISFQFNDGHKIRAMYNQSQFIIDRSKNSITHKRMYAMILLFGSMLIKMTPCLLIVCLCQLKVNKEVAQNTLQRARAGYSMMVRRGATRM